MMTTQTLLKKCQQQECKMVSKMAVEGSLASKSFCKALIKSEFVRNVTVSDKVPAKFTLEV